MNFQYKIVKLSFLVTITISFISCSNKLDRNEAKELISQRYNLPEIVTEKLQHGKILYLMNFGGSNISAQNSLAELKMISFTYQGIERRDAIMRGDKGYSYASYYLELTPEGQKFKIGETSDSEGRQFYLVKVADKVLIDITGILEINDGKAAQVDYTWKYENITPFGKAFSLQRQEINRSSWNRAFGTNYTENQVFSEKVMMVKYDDGWRIQD